MIQEKEIRTSVVTKMGMEIKKTRGHRVARQRIQARGIRQCL